MPCVVCSGKCLYVYISAMQHWKRDVAVFLSSQAISLLGSSIVQYALMWHVTLTSGSGLMMTLYIIAGFVPTFLIAPFGGVLADRYDRRMLMVLADAGIALVTLALGLVLASGFDALWLFFAAAAVRSIGQAVQQPAVGAFLPQIVPQDKLMRVNSINGTVLSVISLASPALAGLLLSLLPLQAVFFIDVATAILAICVLLFALKTQAHARALEKLRVSWFADLRDGFAYIRSHRYLVPFFTFVGLLLVLVTPSAFLTPLQTARTYGREVWRLTALEIAFSGGMVVGGALLAAWGGFANRMRTVLVSVMAMGACTVALGLPPSYPVYLGVMLVYGIAMAWYNTPVQVLLQEHVESAYLGRVYSVSTMLFTSVMPLSMLFFGPLAEVIRIEWMLLGSGTLILALGAAALLNKTLHAFGTAKIAA